MKWFECNLHSVPELIRIGVDCDAIDDKGRTALHMIAAHSGQQIHAKLLISNNANINLQTTSGETPLFIASTHGRKSMVKLLLQHSADPTIESQNHLTAFHQAALNGHVDIFSLFEEQGLRADQANESGWTPIHSGALSNDAEEVLEFFSNKNYDMNIQTAEGFTPLFLLLTSKDNQLPIVLKLLAKTQPAEVKSWKGMNSLLKIPFSKYDCYDELEELIWQFIYELKDLPPASCKWVMYLIAAWMQYRQDGTKNLELLQCICQMSDHTLEGWLILSLAHEFANDDDWTRVGDFILEPASLTCE
jgi:ankyrin repeat protein